MYLANDTPRHEEPSASGVHPNGDGARGDLAVRPGADPQRTAYWRGVEQQKQEILNVRAQALAERSRLECLLARVAHALAHRSFFVGEIALHGLWVVLNMGIVPGVPVWDPYPFSLLTGLASVQALFIGLLILMHGHFEARVSEVREETDLQVTLHSERETTKVLQMLAEIHQAMGLPTSAHEGELKEMTQPLDPEQLRATTAEHINQSEGAGVWSSPTETPPSESDENRGP